MAACTVPDEAAETADPVPSAVLSPAVGAAQGCPIGRASGIRIEAGSVVAALSDHVPRALPPNFGLLVAWEPGPDDPTAGAAWADARCRTIVIRVAEKAGPPATGPAVGDWRLGRSELCSNGLLSGVQCLLYVSDRGADRLILATVGLGREQADGVALSVPI